MSNMVIYVSYVDSVMEMVGSLCWNINSIFQIAEFHIRICFTGYATQKFEKDWFLPTSKCRMQVTVA